MKRILKFFIFHIQSDWLNYKVNNLYFKHPNLFYFFHYLIVFLTNILCYLSGYRNRKNIIFPGMIYLACNSHPTICTETDGFVICGISLIDGVKHIGSVDQCSRGKLNINDVIFIRLNWKEKYKESADYMIKNGWWDEEYRYKYDNFEP